MLTQNLARPGTGLMVKGTTLQDFDEETSVQKTLRKPADMIKNFDGGKLKCKNVLKNLLQQSQNLMVDPKSTL